MTNNSFCATINIANTYLIKEVRIMDFTSIGALAVELAKNITAFLGEFEAAGILAFIQKFLETLHI